jgi:hypothetical protein
MLRRKIRKIILSILLITNIGFISFITARNFINRNKSSEPYRYSQIKSNDGQDVIHKQTIVNGLQSIGKLEVVQASLSHTITINKGYDNAFFRCKKEIQFQGIGKYILDLDGIKESNIIVNNKTKEITVYCKALEASVEVLEDQNLYRNDKGYLTFYSITMQPEQMENIKSSVKAEMMNKLCDEGYLGIAKEKANESVSGILERLTGENYKVHIEYLY